MAQIKNKKKYPLITPKDKDFLVATQESTGKTRSISVGDLSQHVIDKIPSGGGDAPIKDIKFKGESLPVVNKSVEIPSKLSEFDNDLKGQVENIKTIADLRLREGKEEGEVIRLLGYYEAGDKSELLYKWFLGEAEDDEGSIIKVSNGYWSALFNSEVNSKDFGNKGNIIRKIQEISNIKIDKLILEEYEYVTEEDIIITKNINIKFINSSIKRTKEGFCLELINLEKITIEGAKIESKYGNESGSIKILQCKDILIKNLKTVEEGRTGLLIENSDRITVKNCYFSGKTYHILLRGAKNTTIEENYFTGGYKKGIKNNTGSWEGDDPLGDGIKSSPTGSSEMKGSEKTIVRGNHFHKLYRDGIDMFSHAEDMIIVDNVFEENDMLGLDIKISYVSEQGSTSIPETRQTSKIIVSNNIFKNNSIYKISAGDISVKHRRDVGEIDEKEGANQLIINGNRFEGNITYSILLAGTYNSIITNNIMSKEGQESIRIEANNRNVNIDSNIILEGLTISNPKNRNIILNNNIIETSKNKEVVIIRGSQNTITNNRIRGGVSSIRVFEAEDLVISNNNFSENTHSGINNIPSSVSRNKNIKVFNNYFNTSPRGISLNSANENIIVSENIFKGVGTDIVNKDSVINYTENNNKIWT